MRYLVTGREAARIDQYTIEEIGVPQLVLMERAALSVAEQAERVMAGKRSDKIPDKKRGWILVAAEGGNNGGDGVAAARILTLRGYNVRLWLLNGISHPTAAYLKQVELAEKAGVLFDEYKLPDMHGEEPEPPAVVIDAIFGAGLNRELRGIQQEAVKWINTVRNETENTVISLDIPTGISSETGEVLGEEAVYADITVTFGYEKVGMLFAKDHCGRVEISEIGFYPCKDAELFEAYDMKDLHRLPVRPWNGNKGTFGNVLVIAGSEDIYGAAYLASAAAYRTGCGLLRILTHERNRQMLQQKLPEAILMTWGGDDGSRQMLQQPETIKMAYVGDDGAGGNPMAEGQSGFKWADAIAHASVIIIGPGLGRDDMAHFLVEYTLRKALCPVVIDADGINILAEHSELLTETAGKRPVILTPHMLEMARLTQRSQHPAREAVAELKRCRVEIAQNTARELGAILVLKDACTFVTDGKGGYFNTSGNSAMAKGGSGDVLTGVIAGLIAQGMKAAEAAKLGVFIHGMAGDAARDRLGEHSVLAGDLLDEIPSVLK